jgi:hypothetical protein
LSPSPRSLSPFPPAGAWLALLLAAAALRAEAPPGADEWKYDVVHRKKGPPFRGLVLEQTAQYVRVLCVSRKPGSPTVVFRELLPRAEIERLELLGDEDREALRQRLDALKRERAALAADLKALGPGGTAPADAVDRLDLRPVPWPAAPPGRALEYRSGHFRLVSNAGEGLVCLAATRLEQVYAAYARTLPQRVKNAEPTRILLTRSLADYQALARARGHNLLNPAFYDAARNEIVCGSDLERLGDELGRVRRHHETLRKELKDREADLVRVYKGRKNVPPELLRPLAEAAQKIGATEERNARAFAGAQERLFRRLYHEAFHAYLANFVYPGRDEEVPRWLNEGLAQIFETAIVEVGELRVGHADPERLEELRRALARGTLLPLADLLRSGPKQFQVAHAGDQQASDRYYLAAWALAFYLTFDRKLLGTPSLDEYVRALHRGEDAVAGFRKLVGQPLPQFEKEYLQYLKRLRPEGAAPKHE